MPVWMLPVMTVLVQSCSARITESQTSNKPHLSPALPNNTIHIVVMLPYSDKFMFSKFRVKPAIDIALSKYMKSTYRTRVM